MIEAYLDHSLFKTTKFHVTKVIVIYQKIDIYNAFYSCPGMPIV